MGSKGDLLKFDPEKVKVIIEEDNFLSHKFSELKESKGSEDPSVINGILESIFKIYIQGHPTFEYKYSQLK